MDLVTKANNDAELARIPLTGNTLLLARGSLPLTSAAKVATAIATGVAAAGLGAGFGVGHAIK